MGLPLMVNFFYILLRSLLKRLLIQARMTIICRLITSRYRSVQQYCKDFHKDNISKTIICKSELNATLSRFIYQLEKYITLHSQNCPVHQYYAMNRKSDWKFT